MYATPTRAFGRFKTLTAHRTAVDGWFIEAVGTPAEAPDPGQTIKINASATNASDDGGTLTVPVTVDGAEIRTVTFEAAVTGVDTRSFSITVPDAEQFTVAVGGEDTTIRTSTFQPEGTLELGNPSAPATVTAGETFTASIEVRCEGSRDVPCPDGTLQVLADGQVVHSRSIADFRVGDIDTVSPSITLPQAGDVTLEFVLGGDSETTDVTVEAAPTDGDQDGTVDGTDGQAPTPTGLTDQQILAAGAGIGFLVLLALAGR